MKTNLMVWIKLCSALLLLSSAISALAEDFVFTVPFTFQGVQDDRHTLINCYVYDANNGVIGGGSFDFYHPRLPNRNTFHNGNNIPVTIKFNASPGMDASMARRYVCLYKHATDKRHGFSASEDYARSVREVYGTIPHPAPLGRPLPPHSPIR